MKKTLRLIALACAVLAVFTFAKKPETVINVIPYPQSVEVGKGFFKGAGANFNCDQSIDAECVRLIRDFADKITYVTGRVNSFAIPVGLAKTAQTGEMKGFIFLKDNAMGPEEYSIDITKKTCVVKASAYNGFLYAIQTLKQLTDVSIFSDKVDPAQKFMFPVVSIKDKPRFAYRGMHLDCARHFFSVEEVKKYLDIMATYKLNRMHWHLTEDQGWRIEIKKYPKLTQVGAFRNGTMVGKDFKSNDGIRYGGYYTQEQVKDVVAYAQELGITIIPEIDLPGHMLGALAAYPELGCTGGPYEVSTRYGVFDELLCVGKDGTLDFVKGVLEEMLDIFPSEYIHLGGDECPKVRWKECPECQRKIRELGLKGSGSKTPEELLQSWFTSEIEAFLAAHGRRMICWNDVLCDWDNQVTGEPSRRTVIAGWMQPESVAIAAREGYDAILCPVGHFYFSNATYNRLRGAESIRRVYDVPVIPEGLTPEQRRHVLGAEACLWSERVADTDSLEWRLLPRLSTLSELQWSNPASHQGDTASFNAYLPRLRHMIDLYTSRGWHWKTDIAEAWE